MASQTSFPALRSETQKLSSKLEKSNRDFEVLDSLCKQIQLQIETVQKQRNIASKQKDRKVAALQEELRKMTKQRDILKQTLTENEKKYKNKCKRLQQQHKRQNEEQRLQHQAEVRELQAKIQNLEVNRTAPVNEFDQNVFVDQDDELCTDDELSSGDELEDYQENPQNSQRSESEQILVEERPRSKKVGRQPNHEEPIKGLILEYIKNMPKVGPVKPRVEKLLKDLFGENKIYWKGKIIEKKIRKSDRWAESLASALRKYCMRIEGRSYIEKCLRQERFSVALVLCYEERVPEVAKKNWISKNN